MRQSCHLHRLRSALAPQRWVYSALYPLTHSSCKILAVALPDLPLDEFKVCTAESPFTLQIVPHAIGAVFGG